MNRILVFLIIISGFYLPLLAFENSNIYQPGAMSVNITEPVPTTENNVTPQIKYQRHSSYPSSYNISISGSYTPAGFTIRTRSGSTTHSYGGGGQMVYSNGTYTYQSAVSEGRTSVPMIHNIVPTTKYNKYIVGSTGSITKDDELAPTIGIMKRRITEEGDGTYNGEYHDGKWWNAGKEEWVDEPFEGCTKIEDGETWTYHDGRGWVRNSDIADPQLPIGNTPWWFMSMMIILFILYRRHRLRGGTLKNNKIMQTKKLIFILLLSISLPTSAVTNTSWRTAEPVYSSYRSASMRSTSIMNDNRYGHTSYNPNVWSLNVTDKYLGNSNMRLITNTPLRTTGSSTIQSYGGWGYTTQDNNYIGSTINVGPINDIYSSVNQTAVVSLSNGKYAVNYANSSNLPSDGSVLSKNNLPPSSIAQWEQWWNEFVTTGSPHTEAKLTKWWYDTYGGSFLPSTFAEFLEYVRHKLTDEDTVPLSSGLLFLLLLTVAYIIYKKILIQESENNMKRYILFSFILLSSLRVMSIPNFDIIDDLIEMDRDFFTNENYIIAPMVTTESWGNAENYKQYSYNFDDKLSSIFSYDGVPLMNEVIVLDIDANGNPRCLCFTAINGIYISGLLQTTFNPTIFPFMIDIFMMKFYLMMLSGDIISVPKVYLTGTCLNAAAYDTNDPNTKSSYEGFLQITETTMSFSDEDMEEFGDLADLIIDLMNNSKEIDLYLEDVNIKCADKNLDTKSKVAHRPTETAQKRYAAEDELIDMEILGTLSNWPGMSCPIVFSTISQDTKNPPTMNIHIKGMNSLTGGNTNLDFLNLGFMQMISSPIAMRSLARNQDDVENSAGRLSFDDLWPIDVLDSRDNYVHTNGVLELPVAANTKGERATPSIDLGFPNGQCMFDGGQYTFQTAANSNMFFVSSMSVCYKQFTFMGIRGYGLGTSTTVATDKGAVDWNMYIKSGTYNTYSAEEYADKIDVVARGWYNDYTDLRIPLRSIIGEDATFNNCNVYLCEAAGEVGIEPTRTIEDTDGTRTISLCRKKIEVLEGDIDMNTGLKKNSNMTPIKESGKYYVYQYVDATECNQENDYENQYVHNWVTIIPKMGLVMTIDNADGTKTEEDVLTMGGDVTVNTKTTDEKNSLINSFLFYAQLNEYTKNNASVDLQIFKPTVQKAITMAKGSGEPHEYSDITNTDSYTIEHGIYTMMSFKPNQWNTICPPYDIHNVYVMETNGSYNRNKNESGYKLFLNKQGEADGDLAQTIVTSLCPDILSGKGSGVNFNLIEIAEKQLGMKLNEDNDGKGIYTLKHYNPDLGDDHSAYYSNYFLYELSETCPFYGGGLYWNVSNNGDVSNYWTPVTPIAPQTTYIDRLGNEVEENLLGEKVTILMQKGHVYSFYLPETDNAPYWEGKYLVFEGYGPQTLDGKSVQKQFTTITDLTKQEQLYDELGIGSYSEEELRKWIETATNPIIKKQYQDMLDMKISGLTIANYIAFVGNSTFGNDTIGIHAPYNDVESDLLWSPLGTNENGTFTFVKEDRTFYRPFDTWVVASQATMDIVKENMGQQPASLPKLGPLLPENEDDIADLEHLPHIGDVILKAWQQNGISIATFATTNVEVYSLTGIKIWGDTMQDGGYKHLTVPIGLYIIRADNQSVKVMVE